MAGAPDNKNGVALKDPALRQRAYKSYCNHLALGKAKKSWFYEEGEFGCCWATMEKYFQDEAEFDPKQRIIAETKGYNLWESISENSATGADKKKSNTASLQMVMRNKFGWDKDETKSSSNHYTIKVDKDGIATGVSTEAISATNNKGTE